MPLSHGDEQGVCRECKLEKDDLFKGFCSDCRREYGRKKAQKYEADHPSPKHSNKHNKKRGEHVYYSPRPKAFKPQPVYLQGAPAIDKDYLRRGVRLEATLTNLLKSLSENNYSEDAIRDRFMQYGTFVDPLDDPVLTAITSVKHIAEDD